MSLYRTLSQLPNDLPLTLGAKVNPNAAKAQPTDPRPDPLDAWFTPIVREMAPKVGAKKKAPSKVNVVDPCVQNDMTRAFLETHLRRVDEQQAFSRVQEIAGEAKQIVGIVSLRKVLNDEFGAKYMHDLKSEHYAAFIEKVVKMVRERIGKDVVYGRPIDYNVPTWV